MPSPARPLTADLDLADAARHEVEQLLLLEVADRGAVRALDVVGDDLHGGHDRHAGLVAHQERAAQLIRVRLLCDLLGTGGGQGRARPQVEVEVEGGGGRSKDIGIELCSFIFQLSYCFSFPAQWCLLV